MINPTNVIIREFEKGLKEGYNKNYGLWKPEYGDIISWAGREIGSLVSSKCDALYHNLEHMIEVSTTGQEILLGQHKKERVEPEDWLHFMLSCISHDIGYIKNLFDNDVNDRKINSDASMTSNHVDRSKRYILERFKGNNLINAEKIADLIEYTRFPNKPENLKNNGKDKYGILMRAADFIGQCANIHYCDKNMVSLFYEFEEIGANQRFGYNNVQDMRTKYPDFFFKAVHPLLSEAIGCLERTENGHQIITNLYGNVKKAELQAQQAQKQEYALQK